MAAEVALITVYNAAGQLLLGKRNDNGKYTMPGGHLEEGEDPHLGALRELWEETGLQPTSLSFLLKTVTSTGLVIHCFSAYCAGNPQPHGNNDPDQEVTKWDWVDVAGGMKSKYFDHLTGPPTAEEGNVLKQLFDLKKAEADGDSYVAYRFPSEDEAEDFLVNYRRRYEDAWKGIGVASSRCWPIDGKEGERVYVAVRSWDEKNQRAAAALAREFGGSSVEAPAGIFDELRPEARRMLEKAEDEVGRLLENPNPAERLLALRLDSVTPQNLQIASLDSDPTIHQAAIDHKKFGDGPAMHLMEATTGSDGQYPLAQQLAFLARHDRVRPEHLDALFGAAAGTPARAAVVSAVVQHPQVDPALLRKIYLNTSTTPAERSGIVALQRTPVDVLHHALQLGVMAPEAGDLACAAVPNLNLPGEAVEAVIRSAADRPQPHLQRIAEYALANRPSGPDLQDYLFLQAQLKNEPHVLALLANLLQGPSANANLIQRAIHQLPAGVAVNALGSKVPGALQPHHMDALVSGARGDQAVLDRLMQHPMFDARHLQQLMTKAEPLAKKVMADHMGVVANATSPEARALVDHTPDLSAHPGSLGPEVEAYRQQVLNGGNKIGVERKSIGGQSKKRVFRVQVAGHAEPTKMMVKPYHEKVAKGKWAKQIFHHPHMGWSEMTNQALYHAADIGHLHQKVHVAEHDMGVGHEKEPALVVHLEPDHTAVEEYGGRHYDQPSVEKGLNLRKIALMDFLANAQDRHVQNLLINDKTQQPLAIDNSYNFQYKAPNRWGQNAQKREDMFAPYVRDTAIGDMEKLIDFSKVGNKPGDLHRAQMETLDRYAPAFEWWGTVGDKVRKTFYDRLAQIKDPEVRAHLKRNFDARADWLDDRARHGLENFGTDWYNDSVPMYHPDELTDDEQADPEIAEAHRARQAEKAAAKREARRAKVKSKGEYKDWLSSKPRYPHHLGDLSLADRAVHPDWQKYVAAHERWFAKRPPEAEAA